MSAIPNAVGPHCVIVHDDNGDLRMVVPEEVEALPGEVIQWVIVPSELPVEVAFDPGTGSPVNWPSDKGVDMDISGRVVRGAIGHYKYTVTDDHGNKMDPRVRVKR